MKILFFKARLLSIFLVSVFMTSCYENERLVAEKHNSTVVYACPTHPEITGKQNSQCPKCKMDLEFNK